MTNPTPTSRSNTLQPPQMSNLNNPRTVKADGGYDISDLQPGMVVEMADEGRWLITTRETPSEGDLPVESVWLEAIRAPNADRGHQEVFEAEKLITDVESIDVRDTRDLENSDDKIRSYGADGTLYAYRSGNGDHIVVSRGKEPGNRWVSRVPAERTAVVPDEKLWTVPENWVERVRIKDTDISRYAIYHIPESDVDVLVTVPHKNHLVDAWYGVSKVGEISVTYADSWDWNRLEEMIEMCHDEEAVPDDVAQAIEQLLDRRDRIEQKFAEGVNMYAEEAVFESRGPLPPRFEGWTTDPWGEMWSIDANLLSGALPTADDEVLQQVATELTRENIFPAYPTVEIDVDDSNRLPRSYEIKALTEVGCSPSEALDYIMVEMEDYSQSDWADKRGISQPSVSKNIKGAKRHLEA